MKDSLSRGIQGTLAALLLAGTGAWSRAQGERTPKDTPGFAPVPLAVWTVTPSDFPPIDVYDDFEGTTLGKLWATWRVTDGAVQIQSAIVRAGYGAVRITLQPHDFFEAGRNGDLGTERDELAEAAELYSGEGRPYEFAWSMYLPADFPIVPVRLIVAQWKQMAANSSAPEFDDRPVLAVGYVGGVLRITQNRARKSPAVLYRETRDLRGRWLDLRFQVRLTPQSTGFIKAWIDGRQVVDYAGPTANPENPGTGYASLSQYYFDMGLDRDVMAQPMMIYLDEYRKRQLREDELARPARVAISR